MKRKLAKLLMKQKTIDKIATKQNKRGAEHGTFQSAA